MKKSNTARKSDSFIINQLLQRENIIQENEDKSFKNRLFLLKMKISGIKRPNIDELLSVEDLSIRKLKDLRPKLEEAIREEEEIRERIGVEKSPYIYYALRDKIDNIIRNNSTS